MNMQSSKFKEIRHKVFEVLRKYLSMEFLHVNIVESHMLIDGSYKLGPRDHLNSIMDLIN